MNVSHLLEGLCYFTVLIVALAWLCVVCDPFAEGEPEEEGGAAKAGSMPLNIAAVSMPWIK